MTRKHIWFLAIALALTTIESPLLVQAADIEDAEYYASGGLDIINAAAAYRLGFTGKGITLGICDEPINFMNPEFSQKKSSLMVNISNIKGKPAGVYDEWYALAHGTYVAGIAAADRNGIGMQGAAYDAEIAGSASGYDYDYGILLSNADAYSYYLAHPEIKVINNSWGAIAYIDEYTWAADPYAEIRAYIEPYFDLAGHQGKLLVFAAGNGGHPSPMINLLAGNVYPSLRTQLLSVVSLDDYNTRQEGKIIADQEQSNVMSCSSNLAKYMEDNTLAARGRNIYSANADYAWMGIIDMAQTGTSMAAPFAAGAGALVQQAYPYMSAKQIGDVLLSTVNSNIDYLRGLVIQVQTDRDENDQTIYRQNIFVMDDSLKSLPQAELLEKCDEYMQIRAKDGMEYNYANVKAAGNVSIYYDVSWQEIIGQGVLDAGAAVQGPGALNARRLASQDLSSSYTVSGITTPQALYTVDTQGYDSVWSNDIKEIRAGYIAKDSTEADLQARWKYYDTNWLSYTGTDRNVGKSVTRTLMDGYNAAVTASGLAGLHVGLYKTGTGVLSLTGTNTYEGSSIVSAGTLSIDGSVAGDAWSVRDAAAGTAGIISGVGTIKGNLYNHGMVQPSLGGNLTVGGSLYSSSGLGLVTSDIGQSARQLVVAGTADINGSTLQRLDGTAYLPDKAYNFLRAGSITGSLTNTTGSAFSGLLSIRNLAVSGTSGAVTLGLANNAGSLDAGQQWAYDSLPGLLANTRQDSSKQTQLGLLLGASPETAAAGLASAAQSSTADTAAMVMSSLTSMNAIGARTMYLSNSAFFQSGVSPARSDDTVTARSNLIPVDLGPAVSGWLKFSKSWEQMGNNSTNGHGIAVSFGFDHSAGHDWRLGEFFSYGANSFASTSSTLDNKDYRLGIYAIREKGPQQAFLYFNLGQQHNDAKRWISAGGSYLADSSYKSHTIELGGRYTYDMDCDKARSWHRKPYGELQVTRYSQDSYSENGASVWNQSVGGGSSIYSAVTAGLGLEKRMENEEIEVHLGYKRVLSGSDPAYPVHWVDGSDNGCQMRGSGLDKNLLVLGLHAEQNQEDGWRLSGDVELEKGHSQRNIQASVMLKKSW